ncbi:exo-alpha-sialidase [Sphingobacterium sp. SRCM116780]|uniref:sialidase family protein n=1 Tax=Sphingobacterium sp. SRCM116780 TaxID=2907623 RepID=UPI001F3B27E8|nr:sialidase family protein [Sphingobacterium sp. SRCM116780]UIR55272.1 exo-alpha-sialidase [Sphingobacterium sp. SRCM116780]
MRYQFDILFCLLLLSLTSCKSYQPTLLSNEQIFSVGQVDFKQCHASTIQEVGKDSLLSAWFGGTHESNPDVCIWMSLSVNGKWQQPINVANGQLEDKRYPSWNPVLYQHPTSDSLFLYYKIGPNPREWKGYYQYSMDKGTTWSARQALPEGILGPIKNKPLTLKNGVILSPSSTESKEEIWKAHIEVSQDKGKTWTVRKINPDSPIQVIQPSVLLHKDGRIQVLCRSKENSVMTAFSKDQGKTWDDWTPTNLLNPNAATDAIQLKNGYYMIVYNPDIAGKDWWEGRTKLRVALSKDGIKWKDAMQLEDGVKGDEYSYPTLIQDSKGHIHITYTWNRKSIKHVVLK